MKLETARTKYLQLIQTAGLDRAIMTLHADIGRLEPRVFDGGYQPERFKELQDLRTVARELYNYQLKQDSQKYNE